MTVTTLLWHCVTCLATAAPVSAAAPDSSALPGSGISFTGLVHVHAEHATSTTPGTQVATRTLDGDLARLELGVEGPLGRLGDWAAGYELRERQWQDVRIRLSTGEDERHQFLLGQFKPFQVLEELESTRERAFIGKTVVADTFALSRRLGAGYLHNGTNWHLSIGRFHGDLDRSVPASSGRLVRAVWVPWRGTRDVLHVGLSKAHLVSVSAWPMIDGDAIEAAASGTARSRTRLTGLEVVWLHRNMKLQMECLRTGNHATTPVDDLRGCSSSVTWNLDGQPWGHAAGLARTPDPRDPDRGRWQLGLRHAHLQQRDEEPGGTSRSEWAIALNRDWGRHWKLILQYQSAHERADPVDLRERSIGLLLQLHW